MLSAVADAVAAPASPLRLPRPNPDGTITGDAQRIRRLIHLDGRPVVLTLGRLDRGRLHLQAAAADRADAAAGLARARFWSGVDDDLTEFLARYADDPLIGDSVRDAPWLRPYRRPMPFEVLLGAICEQLITDERAHQIKLTLTRRHGRRHDGLIDPPDALIIAGLTPAHLERAGLSASRALTLHAAARAIARGLIDLTNSDPASASWQRLRAIRGIGAWTTNTLALHGFGHFDALPAGDHAYQTAVAQLRGQRPGAKASEEEVIEFFAPYAGWRGVAGWHVLRTMRRRRGPGVAGPRRVAE